MKKRFFLILLILLIAGAAASYLFRDKLTAQYENKETAIQVSGLKPLGMPANNIPQLSGTVKKEDNGNKDAGKDDLYKMFQVDERGNLILNKDTRMNIERLYALNTPEELNEKLQKLSTVLPSTAYRQLANLIDYFDKYLRDTKTIYPPDEAPANVEEALEQLQGMHSLRVKHFGSDVAEALFADDEKINGQLLELMLKDPDENATMAEKAERAQKAYLLMKSKS
ncbi:MAG: lipase secretion chaperone [Smithella sp.]